MALSQLNSESYPLPMIKEEQMDTGLLASVMCPEDYEDGDVEFYYSSPEDLEDK